MSRKIIHQRFKMGEIDYELLGRFHDNMVACLGDEYIVISTPTDLSVLEGDVKIITIDAKSYTTNELLDIIEKVAMYDGLE